MSDSSLNLLFVRQQAGVAVTGQHVFVSKRVHDCIQQAHYSFALIHSICARQQADSTASIIYTCDSKRSPDKQAATLRLYSCDSKRSPDKQAATLHLYSCDSKRWVALRCALR